MMYDVPFLSVTYFIASILFVVVGQCLRIIDNKVNDTRRRLCFCMNSTGMDCFSRSGFCNRSGLQS